MFLLIFFVVSLVVLIYFMYSRMSFYNGFFSRPLSPRDDCEKIYFHLACHEFPWECYHGINFALFRGFASPSIASIFAGTSNFQNFTEKRLNDTNIIMHSWINYGIDSSQGRESMAHLIQIHNVFKKSISNQDFVYMLCSFMVDTMRFIEVFGWRKLTNLEKEAIYFFWHKIGQRMNIKEIPGSLVECSELIEHYIESDKARQTDSGKVLSATLISMFAELHKPLPKTFAINCIHSLLFAIGGKTFIEKLGLPVPTVTMEVGILLIGWLRGKVMLFFPPRKIPNRLFETLMGKFYKAHGPIKDVGPPNILQQLSNSSSTSLPSSNVASSLATKSEKSD